MPRLKPAAMLSAGVMHRFAFLLMIAALLVVGLGASQAKAELFVNINKPNADPLPIAVPDFTAEAADTQAIGRDIAGVIAGNLERCGLFRPIPKNAFIEQIRFGQTLPRFPDWRQINAAALVTGSVINLGNGQVKVSFRLWDSYAETQLTGKEYNTLTGNWRRIAHLISDEIYKRLTGEEGYFDSRVVYVAESGTGKNKVKRLAIMDQDGANHKFLTDGRHLVLTPRFSPNSQEILYMSYAGRTPHVHLRDLQTGREDILGQYEGMSFAPRFSNDGSKIAMSVAKNGTTDLFVMDLRSRRMTALTKDAPIDTSPSFSPDGSQIVFNSDRAGTQQLYIMPASGGEPRRISFGNGRYATPVWSPRGDLIAFTKMYQGRFYIGVMRPDGSGERLITESYLDEGPTWSPNGRVIMFTRETGPGARSRLYSIDVSGYNLREVLTPLEASDPAWSPLLPL
jgi:TolB protein